MSVLDSLNKGFTLSIEVVPPSRGGMLEDIERAVEDVAAGHALSFVSVTDHPGGSAWDERDGKPVKRPLRVKPGTVGVCVALRERFGGPGGVTVVPHLVCVGNDRFSMEDALITLSYAGFDDIFAIRGDERYSPFAREKTADGYASAAELVAHVAALNRGEYAGGEGGRPTRFVVGVAGYPDKHVCAPNLETDLERLAEKLRSGASYVLTQMVFDPAAYASFVRALRALGCDAPVVPGVKPVLSAASLGSIPRTFAVNIPNSFARAMSEARTPKEARLVGLRFCAELMRGLLDAGAPGLHLFTMGRSTAAREALDAVFGNKAWKRSDVYEE